MKHASRKRVLAVAGVTAGLLFSSLLMARWPVPGEEWGEVTYYNSSNQPVGGFRVDCDTTIQYWGVQQGRRGPMQLGTCSGWWPIDPF